MKKIRKEYFYSVCNKSENFFLLLKWNREYFYSLFLEYKLQKGIFSLLYIDSHRTGEKCAHKVFDLYKKRVSWLFFDLFWNVATQVQVKLHSRSINVKRELTKIDSNVAIFSSFSHIHYSYICVLKKTWKIFLNLFFPKETYTLSW